MFYGPPLTIKVTNMKNEGANQAMNTGTAPLSSPGPFPDLMTEQELILFLRIPEVSKAKDYHNVVKNLIRFNDLPRIHICKKRLYPRKAVMAWIDKQTIPGMSLTDYTTADITGPPKKKKYR